MGIQKSSILAASFSQDWILQEYIPQVNNHYTVDKKGYNYSERDNVCIYRVILLWLGFGWVLLLLAAVDGL